MASLMNYPVIFLSSSTELVLRCSYARKNHKLYLPCVVYTVLITKVTEWRHVCRYQISHPGKEIRIDRTDEKTEETETNCCCVKAIKSDHFFEESFFPTTFMNYMKNKWTISPHLDEIEREEKYYTLL